MRDRDPELAEWLQQTVQRLRNPASARDTGDEDPFSDPMVRRRVAELISRSAGKS